MKKSLADMSLAELWQLFPIMLTAPNPGWKTFYDDEYALLKQYLPLTASIHHIGSTAVGTIWAKPIIDILAALPPEEFTAADRALCSHGYLCMQRNEKRYDYNKGYTENGFADRVFHLHLRTPGDDDEIYFCNYLIAHPDIAAEYETLKLSLCKRYRHDRDGYTAAKSAFVKKWTATAKSENEQLHR